MFLVHISQQGVKSPLSFPRECRGVEGGFLAIDQFNEEKLSKIIRVLENRRAGKARPEQGNVLVAINSNPPTFAIRFGRYNGEHVYAAVNEVAFR